MLTKTSAADYATNWQTPLSLPLGQHLTFAPDSTYDIGASAASRPRDLFVGRNASVVGTLTVGTHATPPRIRSTPSQAENLSIESQIGTLYGSGKTAVGFSGNAYWDGAAWQRYDTSKAASLLFASDLGIYMYGAPAGANPAAFTQYFVVGTNGALVLPSGSTQKLLGTYNQSLSGFSTTVVAWTPTPITVSITTTGGLLRIEWSTCLYSPTTANAGLIVGLGWDGAIQVGTHGGNLGAINQISSYSGVFYVSLSAGTHTVTVYVNQLQTGTLSIWNGMNSLLYVTEQKNP